MKRLICLILWLTLAFSLRLSHRAVPRTNVV